jgi:hypothetical protein
MRKKIIFIILAEIIILSALYAYADEGWKAEFDYICGMTDQATDMKTDELNDLLSRCEKLKPIIESSDHPQKKIFVKRLDKCKNLFLYLLEVKSKKG